MVDDLKENYSKAMYHSPQKFGKKLAVIFIDFANAYFNEDEPLFGGEGCQIALENPSPLSVSLCKSKNPNPFSFDLFFNSQLNFLITSINCVTSFLG